MVELYVAKGMKKEVHVALASGLGIPALSFLCSNLNTKKDAETVIKLMSKYEELFIDVMMAEGAVPAHLHMIYDGVN